MKVTVIAFASAREALGAAELEVEVDAGADLEALRRRLEADQPALGEQWSRCAVAIDGEVARGNPTLEPGQEVALLPPVSGG